MLHQKNFLFLGGDRRSLAMARHLSRHGAYVQTWHMKDAMEAGLVRVEDLDEALKKVHAVVLPMPALDALGNVSMTEDKILSLEILLDRVKRDAVVFGGRIAGKAQLLAQEKGILLLDYAASEELQIRNAIATAEGAIFLAMQALEITLHGARAAVLGYGRIGEALTQRLQSWGVKVSVGARKAKDFARIEGQGARVIDLRDARLESHLAEGFDMIFNTVPHRLLSEQALMYMPKETLLIELASAPGGWDPCAPCNCLTLYAPGLPAKYAPQTSGILLGDALMKIWKEEIET